MTVKEWDNSPAVLVIGGGPAGMMAASAAAEGGASVTLLEQNPFCGKKLRITGKGRCNVTNDCAPEDFLKEVTRGQKFLYGSLYRFTPEDTKAYFESLGVPLKTERGRRVFPVSDRAADVAEAMRQDLSYRGVTVRQEKVTGILTERDENGVLHAGGVLCGHRTYKAHAVVIATGGISYPGTGSRGDGHRFARDLGLSVTELKPSLVPVVTAENTAELMGLALKNVTLTVYDANGKTVFSELGEMLFTHFGVTGPLVLSASAHMQKGAVHDYRMAVDLKPALDEKTLDARLIGDFKKFAGRNFANSLGDLLPSSLIPWIVRESGIPPHTKTAEVTKEQRRTLLALLKGMPLTPTAFRPVSEAIVTSGGIDLSEVHPKTMMAKAVPGLFFAGEILDIDAYTGGYNLQIAFSTGRAAGLGSAAYAEEHSGAFDLI